MTDLTFEEFKALAQSGTKPTRYRKDWFYAGITTRTHNHYGDQSECPRVETFWGRPPRIHDFDAIIPVIFGPTDLYPLLGCVFAFAAEHGMEAYHYPHDAGVPLSPSISTCRPIWKR